MKKEEKEALEMVISFLTIFAKTQVLSIDEMEAIARVIRTLGWFNARRDK